MATGRWPWPAPGSSWPCDVDNPLLGPHGAAAVYGPQKGAGPDDIASVDAALERWVDVVDVVDGTTGRPDVRNRAGAGAAGGVGYAVTAVLGVELARGSG